MTRFVRDVRAKVPADDAVPGGVVLFVKLLLDIRGDVLGTKNSKVSYVSFKNADPFVTTNGG